jgi:hypothetical protein
MYTKQVSLPEAEPITRDEAKQFCRKDSDFTADDNLFDLLIKSARTHAENLTGLALARKSYVLYLDEFPTFPFVGSAYAPLFGTFPFYFGYGPATNYPVASPFRETDRLPFVIPITHVPVVEVTKIVYVQQDGTEATLLPGTDFAVDLGSQPARVDPLPGGRWPIGIIALSNVRVFYVAGYSADDTEITDVLFYDNQSPPQPLKNQVSEFKFASGIPADLKLAMLMMVADAYANREISVAGAVGRVDTYDNIIMANREWDFSAPRG